MTKEEALEKLELKAGASQQEIKQQYQEFYNESQMRITNAPATNLIENLNGKIKNILKTNYHYQRIRL